MSASLAAYRVAFAELLSSSPKCYFWTFTFVQVQPIWRCPPAWTALNRQLFNWFGRFQGIRVAEMHQDHGLHFHVVINARLPVQVVRRLSARYGFGRIEVQTVRSNAGTVRYLESYLSKGEPLPCRGLRRWTRMGGLGEPKNNFICQSELAKIIRRELATAALGSRHPLTRAQRFLIMKAVRRSYDDGHYHRPDPREFALHNGREFQMQQLITPSRKPRNQWT